MSDYNHSITIEAPADEVFDFVSDIKNLQDYLPTVHHAEAESGDRVRVQGEAAGHPYDSDGYFRVDRKNKRIDWGSDGENNYSGWLTVEPNDSSRDNTSIGQATNCQLTVSISFEPKPEQEKKFQQQGGDRDEVMYEGIQKALLSIKNQCEGTGGKVESKAATHNNRRQ